MYFTGLADEAARDLPTQIAITKELGWDAIESRQIDGTLIHELPDDAFERVCEQLAGSGREVVVVTRSGMLRCPGVVTSGG